MKDPSITETGLAGEITALKKGKNSRDVLLQDAATFMARLLRVEFPGVLYHLGEEVARP